MVLTKNLWTEIFAMDHHFTDRAKDKNNGPIDATTMAFLLTSLQLCEFQLLQLGLK